MQVDISKNKTFKLCFTFIFALVAFFCINTSKVYAKLNDSAMWGVTANFDAKAFDGTVITNENGKYLEKYHSLLYCAGENSFSMSDFVSHSFNGIKVYNVLRGATPTDKDKMTGCHIASVSTGVSTTGTGTYSNDKFTGFKDADKLVEAFATAASGENWQNAIDEDWWGALKYDGEKAGWWRKKNSIFTWPGQEDGGTITDQETTYMARMSSTLLNSYNDTLALLLNNNKGTFKTIKTNEDKLLFLDFASQVADAVAKDSKSTTSYNLNIGNGKINVKFTVKDATEEEFKKSSYSKIQGMKTYFVKKVEVQNPQKTEEKESILVIWSYPKGYAKGQELYSVVMSRNNKYSSTAHTNYITWKHAAYQATFNFLSKGTDSYGVGSMYEKDEGSWIGQQFTKLINWIVTGLSNAMGLYSLEELCLNTGAREIRYWNGIFPTTWFSASQYFYLFTFTISMLMLVISLVRLAGAKAASTIGNVAKRISLIEGTKKVIVCAIATMLFVPIFQILIQVNNSIVDVMKGIIPEGKELGFTVGATSGMGIAGAIIGIMIFWVTLKMNFTYILRAVTILICYILGPIAIMCSALGDRFAMITSNWLKELVGNIFIQSIHAMIMMVYINIAGTGSIASIEKLVIFYSFVPLTEFVRTNLFNLGKGLNDVADNLSSGISDAAGAVTSAAVMNRRFNSMKNASGSSASGDISLKDKSSSLNNASGDAMPEGKVGFGDKVRAGMSGLGQGLKSGAVGGVKGLGRAAVNTPGALAHASIAAGMALGSGAANSQGRMSMGATRAFGATVAEGINGTSGSIDRGFSGGFSEGYADGVNNYNSMKDLTENGLTAEQAKVDAGSGGLGLDLNNMVTDDKGNTYAYVAGQGKAFANEGNGLKTYTDANGNSESAYIKNGAAYAKVNISNAGKDSNGSQKFRISSAGNANTILNGQRNNATQAKARTQATINNAKSSAINVDTAKVKNATARENYTRVSK
jgi:hypothetical protein